MTENPSQPPPSPEPSASKQVPPNPPPPPDKRHPPAGPKKRQWIVRILVLALLISVVANFVLYEKFADYFASGNKPIEKFHSGSATASDKIAIIRVEGTIMPPLTERVLREIKQAKDDDDVKGVLLTIDSPGGLVADSHQIYHHLKKLHEEHKKPVFVAMKRLAASGGYYIAMGAGPEGRIFAEPTTWTGSIGVIIPRYDVSGLADNWNIKSVPLKTGKFKDALSPFHELSSEERQIWGGILNESFSRFLHVVGDNRPNLTIRETQKPTAEDDPEVVPNYWELVSTKVPKDKQTNLATGRIFTAASALSTGLVDEIGFEEDALDKLQEKLGLDEVRVVKYQSPFSLWEMLLGYGKAQSPEGRQQARLDASVPQAMYYFSWVPPAIPAP